jgi:hypothetical protein
VQVALPVCERDSLAAKVETLRIFLEQELGMEMFLQLYHRLENLPSSADAGEAAAAIHGLIGDDNVHFIPLVHQLITTEEVMHAAGVAL